eukprot:symbB.v1.2.023615.t1/scaffold2174.1/size86949/2
MKRPSFGTVEWCPVSPAATPSVSSVNPLAQTQAASFFDTRSTLSSSVNPPTATSSRMSSTSRPFSAAQDTRSSKLGGSAMVSRIFAIPGYTGHIPNKDTEVCGGTFTVESMAAAAIRSRLTWKG